MKSQKINMQHYFLTISQFIFPNVVSLDKMKLTLYFQLLKIYIITYLLSITLFE